MSLLVSIFLFPDSLLILFYHKAQQFVRSQKTFLFIADGIGDGFNSRQIIGASSASILLSNCRLSFTAIGVWKQKQRFGSKLLKRHVTTSGIAFGPLAGTSSRASS